MNWLAPAALAPWRPKRTLSAAVPLKMTVSCGTRAMDLRSLSRVTAQSDAVDADAVALRMMDAQPQREHRTFASVGTADEDDRLAGTGVQREVFQRNRVRLGGIVEAGDR